MIEAATFLLMTPEGARMRRAAKLVAPPAPRSPPAAPHTTRIVMPGWHTIAALQLRIDPRVVERESLEQAQREMLARAKAAAAIVVDLPGPEGLTRAAHDPHDPATWRCGFPVIRWKQADIATPPKPHTSRLLCAVIDDDSSFPLTHDLAPSQPRRELEPTEGHAGAIAVAATSRRSPASSPIHATQFVRSRAAPPRFHPARSARRT